MYRREGDGPAPAEIKKIVIRKEDRALKTCCALDSTSAKAFGVVRLGTQKVGKSVLRKCNVRGWAIALTVGLFLDASGVGSEVRLPSRRDKRPEEST